ncbi:MAG TPA: hypothetical protein VHS53_01400 [Mucilaginibacter sp.]|jgi:hypothetical protein|nr:hypothetical protein [Mucilaginibacter sp.]
MKIMLKPSIKLSLTVLFIFLVKTVSAQYPGMRAFRAQQNRQFINQQMQMQMQMMNMLHTGVATVQEYDFNVTLRDSTTKLVTSAIYRDSLTKRHFIVLVDKRFKKTDTNRYKKIYPSQTRSLTCVLIAKTDDDPGHYVPGVITDSCWMFKTLTGSINVYTFDSCSPTGDFDEGAIVGVQLKNGPIVAYTEENLKTMAGNDLEVQQLILEKKYVRAIKKYNRNRERNKPADKPESAN